MAGLYETLLAQTASPIFGNVATTPASVATTNARIAGLQQNVANAQAALEQAKSVGGVQSSPRDKLYNYYLGQFSDRYNPEDAEKFARKNADDAIGSLTHNYQQRDHGASPMPLTAQQSAIMALLSDNTSSRNNAVTDAQNALTTAQTRLNNALARQDANRLAGEQAVQWGQTARNAEQQGIARAAQMYQQAMQGEAVRNAIMNGAIGTVGNFNMGGGR